MISVEGRESVFIYIAGPMTGYDDFNYPAFRAAAEQLGADGYLPLDPSKNYGGDQTRPRTDYLRCSLRQILRADGVAVLPGWEKSAGARMEIHVAHSLGLPIHQMDCWTERKDCHCQPLRLGPAMAAEAEGLPPEVCPDACRCEPNSYRDAIDRYIRDAKTEASGTRVLTESEKRRIEAKGWTFTPMAYQPTETPRESMLNEAKKLVTGDRNNQYGPPTKDFQRIAAALTALGYRREWVGSEVAAHAELEPKDVAVMMACVKLSRIVETPGKRDSWVDLAGYAACGYECTTEES